MVARVGTRASCTNLSMDERREIENLHRQGKSTYRIGALLGRHPTTIQKELAKGKCKQKNYESSKEVTKYKYDWYYSQKQAELRAQGQGRRAKLPPGCWQFEKLHELLKLGYSPYAAIEVARRNKQLTTPVCVSTLYSYIASGKYGITHNDLMRPSVLESRRKTEERNRVREAKTRPAELSIDNRPKIVVKRQEFGHWEGDLIVSPTGKGTGCFLTLVERKTRFLISAKIPSKKQQNVIRALDSIERHFGRYFSTLFRTITWDNGIEFVNYKGMVRSIYDDRASPRFDIYYAHPYRSGERGTNEVTNGFLRRYFPKVKPLVQVAKEELQERTEFINNYPRKILKGKCAARTFEINMRRVIGKHDAETISVPDINVA